jgi:hypothetical protein
MKTLLKLAALGGLAAVAVNIYRRQQQRYDRELPGSRSQRRDLDAESGNRPIDQVADTNSVVTGDPAAEQRAPQPQDWRGAQNVLE